MDTERIRAWKAELTRDRESLVFVSLVDTLRRMRRFDEARRYALAGLEQHPHLAAAHDALARVLADLGDDTQARDEWEFALRLDPIHHASLRGMGFLAYKRRDLAAAEQFLARALQVDQADDGLANALRRVREELRGSSEPAPAAAGAEAVVPARGRRVHDAKQLFAALLGDGDRTALLLDRDGLVIAGTYVDGSGQDVADEIGAHLGGLADEASRALTHLGLGDWNALMVESQHATVALAPASEGAIVLVAAARDTQVGFVRRLLMQAARQAGAWMGRAA